MKLKDTVTKDMKDALKSGAKERLSTLRMLVSAMHYAEIEKRGELTDDEALEVVSREIKRRRESIEEYEKGNRPDLVKKEQAELEVLEGYMPPQLAAAEIEKIVKQAVDETGAMGPADLGKVMGAVMAKVKGKADGKLVNEIARRILG